jgi:hypothetical protein
MMLTCVAALFCHISCSNLFDLLFEINLHFDPSK